MTKKHSTKKALVASLLSLVLCCSMLIGTTFAWFTDSVTSANNIIKSGNLDVEMYWADGTLAVPADGSADWIDASTGAIFDYDLWEPGYAQVRHIKIANEGSLALKYKVNIVANGEVSDLSDVIDVYYVDPAVQVADRSALTEAMKLGTLTEVLANLGNTGLGTLEAGKSDTITIAFKMQESAGNQYQNKSIGTDFSIQIFATQYTSESDSFDNQYDAAAMITVNNAQEFRDAINEAVDGSVIVLSDDIDLGTERVTIKGKEITINLNGNDIVSSNNRTIMVDLLSVNNADKRGVLTLIGNGTVKNTQNDAKNGFAVYVGGSSDLIIKDGATVESVYGKAIIMAPMGAGRTSTLSIDGGSVIGNYAITGYGSARDTSIYINLISGTIYGKDVAIYQPMFGTVTINGGTVKGDGEAAIAMRSGDLVVNDGAVAGIIDVLGDHHVSNRENATTDVELNGGDFTAATLKYAVGNGNVVTKAENVKLAAPAGYIWANGRLTKAENVATANEIKEALASGKDVLLANDVETTDKVIIANGSVFDGNGNTIDFGGGFTGYEKAVNVNNGTLQNITVDNAYRAVGADGCTNDIYLDNVTITNARYAFNGDTTNNSSVYFSNSTIDGWISYGGRAEIVSFKNCELIGKTSMYYGLGYYVVYSNALFENCTFDNFYMGMNKGALNAGAAGTAVTIKNCVVIVNGEEVQLTAENFKTLMMGPGDEADFARMIENTTILVDGVAVSK